MPAPLSRRRFLAGSLALGTGLAALARQVTTAPAADPDAPAKARIAITLDLEMSRNFPVWDAVHWDYEKGNLDADTRQYTVDACRRIRERGGVAHCFCVGRVLEQENVDWLKALAADGHRIGNHTYDHVNVLATKPADVQFRFARAPWLMRGLPPADVIRDNIRMTNEALQTRLGVQAVGFRTPGGFAHGLREREDVQKMLLDLGFTWCSSKYPAHQNTKPGERPTEAVFADIVRAQADAQPFVYPSGLVEIPMSPISDIGAFRTGRWPVGDFVEAIRRSVAWAIEHRAVFDFLCHPSCLLATDPKFAVFDAICDLVEAAGDRAEIVTLDAIAASVRR